MDIAIGNQNKVKYMATQLLAKFEENAPPQSTGIKRQPTQERGVSHPSCCLPEQGRPAPIPQWKQQREKERSRTCPKKVITLTPPPTPPPCRARASQQVSSLHALLSCLCLPACLFRPFVPKVTLTSANEPYSASYIQLWPGWFNLVSHHHRNMTAPSQLKISAVFATDSRSRIPKGITFL